ncbi:glutamine amidotransferase class-I [Candidatus Rhodobacter oscarellae]|uniref:Glutamine amidotransferase class-I n=1 Tax=Candidatus Rhodobacter oscarellae TaxID=1675527 RepID=A0A0J9E8U2_9RHOB|nr:glutamine amidotransferase [Candidatus Rhodobacter lobularis]KMW58104.1 glutamine amidotransferase class-I [Candidatus Rhodobacter lobularis]
MKPFLILQLRPETEAADGEFAAFLAKSGLPGDRVHRIRLDREPVPDGLDLAAFAGTILGGGPGCVSDDPARKDPLEARMEAACLALMAQITARDLPFMGCCAGIGVLGHHLGADVSKARYGEPIGPSTCVATDAGVDDPLLSDLPRRFDAFVGHKEALQELPKGCAHLLSSKACPFQMIRYGQNVYATQFHPEADAQEFATRIRIYKDRGYFAPEEADGLIEICRAADVTVPERILSRFVQRYG